MSTYYWSYLVSYLLSWCSPWTCLACLTCLITNFVCHDDPFCIIFVARSDDAAIFETRNDFRIAIMLWNPAFEIFACTSVTKDINLTILNAHASHFRQISKFDMTTISAKRLLHDIIVGSHKKTYFFFSILHPLYLFIYFADDAFYDLLIISMRWEVFNGSSVVSWPWHGSSYLYAYSKEWNGPERLVVRTTAKTTRLSSYVCTLSKLLS